MPSRPELAQLLFFLDTAYDHVSWHGTNLRGSIRGVSIAQADWRPARNRHNIWELVVHAAYWKYVVWRRLTGSTRGSFPLTGSNWLTRPAEISNKAWRADIQLLEEQHRRLRSAVVAATPDDLRRKAPRSKFTNRALVTGAAAHDLYHAGQIQLLKRLSGLDSSRGRRRRDGTKIQSSRT